MTDAHGPADEGRRDRMRRFRAFTTGVVLVVLGTWLVTLGEADDSPGLGGLGIITALIGLVMALRTALASRRGNRTRPGE